MSHLSAINSIRLLDKQTSHKSEVKMKFVVAFLLLIVGLAVAQDEVVTEAPTESTIEPAVTESSQANEVSSAVEEKTTNDSDKDVMDLPDPRNSTMASTECVELNRKRESLLDCCEYPHIRFYEVFAKYCVDECVGIKDICCSQICVWRKTKIITEVGAVNVEGLKETLIESVTNKSEWIDLVEKNVATCAKECELNETFNV